MKKQNVFLCGIALTIGAWMYLVSFNVINTDNNKTDNLVIKPVPGNTDSMKLGAFSVSLNVKDLKTSKEFYENLGFTVFGGSMEYNYLIMKNESTLIGLFQGMFEKNMLTFNPGWDDNAKNLEKFNDVREIQKRLKEKGIKITNEADEKSSGPASFIVSDPDGNVILFDQHR
jgi:predicted enzyme related to lactoylglutathione lyase